MKKYLKLLTTLLVMAFLCMSCGGNGSVNSTEKESNANSEEEPSNPLNIIGMTPVYEMSSDGKECYLKYSLNSNSFSNYMNNRKKYKICFVFISVMSFINIFF